MQRIREILHIAKKIPFPKFIVVIDKPTLFLYSEN
jgi:hypothetical protein